MVSNAFCQNTICPTRCCISDNCIDPIGMEKGLIPDGALSDSVGSSYDVLTNARLNKKVKDYPFGWAPLSKDLSKKDWIQADLGSVHKVSEIGLRSHYGFWKSHL